MKKVLINISFSFALFVANILGVSAVGLVATDDSELVFYDYFHDLEGGIHQIFLSQSSDATFEITDENGRLIGIVEFGSGSSSIERTRSQQMLRNSVYGTSQFVSLYDVWNPNYSYFYEQNYFRVTYYGTVIIPLLQSTLAGILASLVTPKKASSEYVNFVYGLAVGTIGFFSGNKYTYYWRKYYSLNVFCPILGRPQFRFYSSSSYAVMLPSSTFVTPLNTAEWYGGTPYDYTQPAQCRDLVLQYP